MQLSDLQSLRGHSETPAEGVTLTQLYPHGEGNGLVAVDLLEVEAGATLPMRSHAEEQVLFVVSGTGELVSGDGMTVGVRGGSVVSVSPMEGYSLRNVDNVRLRVLISSSLVARTARALGVRSGGTREAAPALIRELRSATAPAETPPSNGAALSVPDEALRSEPDSRTAAPSHETVAPEPETTPASMPAPPAPVEAPAPEDAPQPPADISGLMKRGSDVSAKPRSEQRKPPAQPEPEADAEEPVQEGQIEEAQEESPEQSNLMELQVVFDGGSRGNPGQGYGSYLVQSPGRRPVIKQVEFGDNYTGNQAEYDSLISALEYIVDRLTATGRTPEQVQLDIKTDSDLVVNQLTGAFKVKDASLRKRHDRANALLGSFADWTISWHARDESVRLLGH